MAKSYLWAIEQDARRLRQQLKDDDNLPGWVQAKIVTAQDRIAVVDRYMGHKIARAEARTNPSREQNVRVALGIVAVVGTLLWLDKRGV
jgi:hypothetical protein